MPICPAKCERSYGGIAAGKADVRSTTVQTPYLAGKGSGRAEDEGLVEGGRAEGAAGSGTEWRMGERAGDGAADGIRL